MDDPSSPPNTSSPPTHEVPVIPPNPAPSDKSASTKLPSFGVVPFSDLSTSHEGGSDPAVPAHPQEKAKAPVLAESTTSAMPLGPMDLDADHEEEEQVLQILSLPPGSSGLLTLIKRQIQSTIQESVQASVRDAVTTTVVETVERVMHELRVNREQEVDEDADDESDTPVSRPGRKKSRFENNFHNVMRGWLDDKGLWFRDKPLPPLPHAQDVADFIDGIGDGPDAETPLFDWTEPYTNVWNDELLGLLAEEFIPIGTAGTDPDDIPAKYSDLGFVKDLIKTKLRGVKTAFLRRYSHGTGRVEESAEVERHEKENKAKAQSRSRHTSRNLGTWLRRKKIIQYFLKLGIDPEFWTAMSALANALGRRGMSSDESSEEDVKVHTPYSRGRKIVRRVPLRWLNGEIAFLWRYVEARYASLPSALKRGNPPYERHFESKPLEPMDPSVAQHLSVVKGLPTNWYDALYWRHLTAQGKKAVSRTAPQMLPKVPGLGGGEPMDASS
ncbi:hypothetical protein NMY22_g10167 [Coprinellus aureogranulatus]|nr:hypothetical protein NMY22_g10167 [Coprinellus aureogranulatus]